MPAKNSPKKMSKFEALRARANLPEQTNAQSFTDIPFLLTKAEEIDGDSKYEGEFWRMTGHTADGAAVSIGTGGKFITPMLAALEDGDLPMGVILTKKGNSIWLEEFDMSSQEDLPF